MVGIQQQLHSLNLSTSQHAMGACTLLPLYNAGVLLPQATCRQHPATVVLAHTFIDEPYNRTGFTLAANSIPEVCIPPEQG